MDHSMFFYAWPWMGLGAACVLLILAFGTDFLRSNTSISRWKDPAWVAWLGAIAYMLHNFEEYGIDLTGGPLGFTQVVSGMGITFGEGVYYGCNLPLVWIVGPAMAILARKYPVLVGAMTSFEMINGIGHVAFLFRFGYNAGVLTAVLIFIPLAIYTFRTFFNKKTGLFRKRAIPKLFAVAALYMLSIISVGLIAYFHVLPNAAQAVYIVAWTLFCGWIWSKVGQSETENTQASE